MSPQRARMIDDMIFPRDFDQEAGGQVSRAPIPGARRPGTPFSMNILALAIYLRFTPQS
jgi:hypothetical protein